MWVRVRAWIKVRVSGRVRVKVRVRVMVRPRIRVRERTEITINTTGRISPATGINHTMVVVERPFLNRFNTGRDVDTLLRLPLRRTTRPWNRKRRFGT